MKWRLPFEGKFRLFLVLLVLLMVLLVFFQTQVLRRVRVALGEESARRMQMVTREAERALPVPRPGVDRPLAAPQADAVRRLARRTRLLAVDLVTLEGTVAWSSLSTRIGSGTTGPDRFGAGSAGSGPYASRFTYLVTDGYHWRLEHPAADLARSDRQLRALAWIQGGAILVALIAVLMFARWTLSPYRQLAHTVQRAFGDGSAAGNGADLPDFLLDSFRGVLDKLESQQHELSRLRGGDDLPFRADMLEGLAGGFVSIRPDGTVAAANSAAAALLGRRRDQLVGAPFGRCDAAGGRLTEIIDQALADQATFSREVVPFERPDGAEVHLGVSAGPVLDGAGGAAGAICLLTDLTEIREVEERVRKRETLATVGEWSAGMAHEFRNSLGTIVGLTRLLMRRLPESERDTAQDILDEVGGSSRHLDDFLQFARPARLRTEPIDLGPWIDRIAAAVSLEFPGRLQVRREGEFPELQADPDLLRRAFRDLLRNAVESGGDGPIEVRIRADRVPHRDRIRIEFEDNGPGIPDDEWPHLFTPFHTTKPDGTGLGLPLARKILLSHDGDIRVERPAAGGTRFVVELPLQPVPTGGSDPVDTGRAQPVSP